MVIMARIPALFLHQNHMKFPILCKELGFEEIPGINTWGLDGSSVSAEGGREQAGQKRLLQGGGWDDCTSSRPRQRSQLRARDKLSQGQIP